MGSPPPTGELFLCKSLGSARYKNTVCINFLASLLGFLRMSNANRLGLRSACLIFLIFFLLTRPAYASGAELTNLVIKNNREDLLIDLKIDGVFTNEMRAALVNGIPVSFSFLVILYEVHDFRFDTKLADVTTHHKIWYTINFIYWPVARCSNSKK